MNAPIKIPELQAGKPEISMAPLIDVIFLLLIFFMVTTVFPENRGIAIESPVSKTSERLPLKKITFSIDNQNRIYFKKLEVSIPDLQRIVEEQLLAAPDTAILLKIDKQVNAQTIISAMDSCKQGGAERIGIATKKNDELRAASR